jgi:hypothetical protein
VAVARQPDQLADRELTDIRAELGDPPNSLAASDRRQRRQIAVLAGQREQVRGVIGAATTSNRANPACSGGASNSTASITSRGTGPRRPYWALSIGTATTPA